MDNFLVTENNNSKKEKASNILFIIGAIFLIIGFIILWFFADSVYDYLVAEGNEQAGAALGVVLMAVYFGFPGLVVSAIATALHIASFVLSKNRRVLKLIFMILAIAVLLLQILFFILINVG